jgi:hypothetical protein
MKLQPDKSDTTIITGYGAGWVSVGFFVDGQPQQEKVQHSIVIGSHGERLDWHGIALAQLTPEHFEQRQQTQIPHAQSATRPDASAHWLRNDGHTRRMPHLQHPRG